MLDLIDDVVPLIRRAHELEDATILNPFATNPLVQGEWLEKVSGVGDVAKRGTANPATVPSFPVFTERGRTDTQALGKVSLILGPNGSFEADTDIFDATGLTQGEALEVTNVTIGGLTKRGLGQYTNGFRVGHVTKLPADNGGKLRFRFALQS